MRRALAALALAAAAVSCAGAPEMVRELTRPADLRSEAYREALDRWTRSGEVPDRADAALSVTATLKSAEFRERYAAEYAAAYGLSEAEFADALAAQRAEASREVAFHLLAYTSDRKANDLDRAGSVWRVYLELPDGRRLDPEAVARVDRKSRLLEGFYPYGDPWSRAYAVRFRAADLPEGARERPRLVLTGVLGTLALQW